MRCEELIMSNKQKYLLQDDLDRISKAVSHENLNFVRLDISTYKGVAANAEHYYGTLIFKDYDHKVLGKVELQREITLEEARYLDRKELTIMELNEESDYLKGLWEKQFDNGVKNTIKFLSKVDIIKTAYEFCRRLSEEIDYVVELRIDID